MAHAISNRSSSHFFGVPCETYGVYATVYQQLNLIDGFKYVYMIVYVHLGKHEDSDTNI